MLDNKSNNNKNSINKNEIIIIIIINVKYKGEMWLEKFSKEFFLWHEQKSQK